VLDEPSWDAIHLARPRDDADVSSSISSEALQNAAQEHGAAGFGNTTQADRGLTAVLVLVPNYSHLPAEDRPEAQFTGTRQGAREGRTPALSSS
jgi:hypothetical protein